VLSSAYIAAVVPIYSRAGNAECIGPLERVGSGDKQASTSRISADLFVFPFLLTDAFLFSDRRVLLGCLAAWLPRCLAASLPRYIVLSAPIHIIPTTETATMQPETAVQL
jgi:hypothetical protein